MLCTIWNLRILQRHWTGMKPRSSTPIGLTITQFPLPAHAA
jgi:hypothetical protein